ncbi:MAG: acyl-[ACP]--phospholipid O-acyltransferase [Proteobacteria bacterium]|nr:acyl-[ACP]--phospholipid O-acyltransferase [Pseudomonadota bacterium]
MIRSLLTERRFAPLFWCQFFAAFNDNFLKNALLFLILWGATGAAAHGAAPHGSNALVTLAGAFFILPFFLLSGIGGEMADRFDKAMLAQRIKLAELGAGLIAVAGFLVQSVPILFVALFSFGILSALFGPVKYGILPDHLPREDLPQANALVEGATFMAIIGGTVAGGLAATFPAGHYVLAVAVMVFALLSWLTARLIPPTGEAAPDLRIRRNIFGSTVTLIRDLRVDHRIWRASLASSWFWLVGAIALAMMPAIVQQELGGTRETATLALVVFCFGIAIGSLIAAWLSGGRATLLPAAIGTALMGVFLIDIWVVTHGRAPHGPPTLLPPLMGHVIIDLFALSLAGGLLAVPTFAAVQAWAGPDRRARAVAGVNVISAASMTIGALMMSGLLAIGVSVPLLFAALGVSCLAVAVWMLMTLPTGILRDLMWMIFRIAYRIEVVGTDHLAEAGPRSIIALNHVSWLDAALALAILDRPPVFAIDRGVADVWWVRIALRYVHAIPLDPARPFGARRLIHAVQDGQNVVIFPEGRITVTGSLMKVYDGAAMIAARADATIVPVRISGLEATPFSRLRPGQVRRRWFPRVRVTILEPERLMIDPHLHGRRRREVGGAALYGIMSDLIWRTTSTDLTIFEAVAAAAKIHGKGRIAAEDTTSGTMTYRRVLTGAAVLGRALAPLSAPAEAVGVLMPNANATMALVLGLMSSGRVPAMLNFTAGPANVLNACRAAQVRTIVTSRAFVARGQLEKLIEGLEAGVPGLQPKLVYLEDLRGEIGLAQKLRGMVQGGRPLSPRSADDPAAIVFTSGSEGTPKGVVLSHRNMLANIAQIAARMEYGRTDKVFNVLPLFHSFGLTCGLVLPLVYGVPVFMYPSPLHYKTIPELIYTTNATALFGTDTFLAAYARSANAYDFRSLRYVIAGAEPVKSATRATYLEKFGLRLLEGYGVTETGPVLALNTPMFNRFGTVGRLLPGIEARLAAVPGIDIGGRLQVRGPNVMLGYLRAEQPGMLEPPPDGWHDTGDIVAIDEDDGYLSIKGRAKRFAKLGGEMVSLAAVDALAGELWPDVASTAVALPDPRKGERIMLLTEQPGADRSAILAHARARGATELMVPADVRVVEAVPLLGSGKIDFVGTQRLAEALVAASQAA